MNSTTTIAQPDRVDPASSAGPALADAIRRYGTSAWSCGCPDHHYRQRDCKHMRAWQLACPVEPARPAQPASMPTPIAVLPAELACDCVGILFGDGEYLPTCASLAQQRRSPDVL